MCNEEHVLFALLLAATPIETTIEVGLPRLPRVAVLYKATPRFRIGGAATFDYTRFTYAPLTAFSPAGGVSIPMLITLQEGPKSEVTLLIEPGVFLAALPSLGLGALLTIGFEASGRIGRVSVGGGVEIPMSILAHPGFGFDAPILIGPRLAFVASDRASVFVRAKAGPGISPSTIYLGRPYFAALLVFGVTFR